MTVATASSFLRPRESVAIITAGAGGYGDPRERDCALVRGDLAEGTISERVAREVCGLTIRLLMYDNHTLKESTARIHPLPRGAASAVEQACKVAPVGALNGARQTGKTTLEVFPLTKRVLAAPWWRMIWEDRRSDDGGVGRGPAGPLPGSGATL